MDIYTSEVPLTVTIVLSGDFTYCNPHEQFNKDENGNYYQNTALNLSALTAEVKSGLKRIIRYLHQTEPVSVFVGIRFRKGIIFRTAVKVIAFERVKLSVFVIQYVKRQIEFFSAFTG